MRKTEAHALLREREGGTEGSSKGKTSDFGSENRGSIPLPSTKFISIFDYDNRGFRNLFGCTDHLFNSDMG